MYIIIILMYDKYASRLFHHRPDFFFYITKHISYQIYIYIFLVWVTSARMGI